MNKPNKKFLEKECNNIVIDNNLSILSLKLLFIIVGG